MLDLPLSWTTRKLFPPPLYSDDSFCGDSLDLGCDLYIHLLLPMHSPVSVIVSSAIVFVSHQRSSSSVSADKASHFSKLVLYTHTLLLLLTVPPFPPLKLLLHYAHAQMCGRLNFAASCLLQLTNSRQFAHFEAGPTIGISQIAKA